MGQKKHQPHRSKEIAQDYCPVISSSSGKTDIPVKMHKTRHPNSGGIPMYQGTITQ